jgi:hypothetical protein
MFGGSIGYRTVTFWFKDKKLRPTSLPSVIEPESTMGSNLDNRSGVPCSASFIFAKVESLPKTRTAALPVRPHCHCGVGQAAEAPTQFEEYELDRDTGQGQILRVSDGGQRTYPARIPRRLGASCMERLPIRTTKTLLGVQNSLIRKVNGLLSRRTKSGRHTSPMARASLRASRSSLVRTTLFLIPRYGRPLSFK